MRRVLITGASGFLGGATARALSRAGYAPVALVRASSDTRALEDAGVALRVAGLLPEDAAQRDALARALDDIDVVIHAAGGGRARTQADFDRNNVHTTRALVHAAERAGVGRVVFVSSMAARGPASCGDRAAPCPDAPITAYGRAKLEAEAVLADAAIPFISLRPPGIYGPGDDRHLPLFRAALRGIAPVPSANRSAAFIHVDDCARAIVACVDADDDAPLFRSGPYYPEDGGDHSAASMARAVGDALGRTPRVVRVPDAILHTLGAFNELRARLFGVNALLNRDKVRDLTQPHWVCDASAFRRDAGWAPQITLADGLRETAEDYRRRGWIA